MLLLLGVALFAAARYAGSLSGQVASVFFGLGTLIAFVSWFQMRLEERESAERLEVEELARTKSSSTLFETKDAAFFPARNARISFEKYFVTGFMVVLLALEIFAAFWLWRWTGQPEQQGVISNRMLVALGLFGVLALILFMFGRFSVTLARLESNRLLRAASNFVLLGSYLAVLAGLALLGEKIEF